MSIGEHEPVDRETSLSAEMQKFLAAFKLDPTQTVECVFGDGPAIMVRDMNKGCVALKTTVVQPLCQQHDIRRTPMDGDIAVVDLSVGAAWSAAQNTESLFIIEDGQLQPRA